MQPAEKTPETTARALGRDRARYRDVSKRRVAWLLLKDTVNSCMEHRVLGLAAEAAFFTLISIPPLLLGLIGLLGYLDNWIGTDTIHQIRFNYLDASAAVLSDKGVDQLARPLIDDVIEGGRPDVISVGFALALWSGSRAVNVFIDTITVMYGLDGHRGIVATRLLAFGLYLAGLLIGAIALPLMVAGPDAATRALPQMEWLVPVFYWPVVVLLSIAFLTTLYHVSVPVRTPWREDIPGALVALLMWLLGSFLLRLYLTNTIEGPTIYGSLAAPVAVLLWIGVSAFAVLVGAAVNAAIDRVWPSVATAAARRVNERARERVAAEVTAAAQARRAMREAEGEGAESGEEPEPGPDPQRDGPRAPGRADPERGGGADRPDAPDAPDGSDGPDGPEGSDAPDGRGERGERGAGGRGPGAERVRRPEGDRDPSEALADRWRRFIPTGVARGRPRFRGRR